MPELSKMQSDSKPANGRDEGCFGYILRYYSRRHFYQFKQGTNITPGNDYDSDFTIILDMDEHMQRIEDEGIDNTLASPDFFDPESINRDGYQLPVEPSLSPSPDLLDVLPADGDMPQWMPLTKPVLSPEGVAGLEEDDIIVID
ncbi:hypothetical protein JTB14_036276 [Gonioctena quinquepunctata]|nr:hypothetical protein JTB14_036276 [Gonioctena quinquepunctata]